MNKLEYQRAYYAKNREAERERKRIYYQKCIEESPVALLLRTVKSRANRKGITFNLTPDDIRVPELCPVFLRPFARNTKYAPSIDRIDPTIGYEPDNVQVLSYQANSMKYNATIDELKMFADWVYRNG